jgi:hypothetical protein
MTTHHMIVAAGLLLRCVLFLGLVYVVLMCIEHFIEEVWL